jgi:hypothetical protein
MHVWRSRLLLAVLAGAFVAAAGCWYQAPNTQRWYDKVSVGMTEADVIKALGPPTAILESEMFYIYDDPRNPVRFRFVFNENDLVIAKYYESKKDLAKRTEETRGEESTAVTPPPPNEPKYPGGPLPRFEKKPGENY